MTDSSAVSFYCTCFAKNGQPLFYLLRSTVIHWERPVCPLGCNNRLPQAPLTSLLDCLLCWVATSLVATILERTILASMVCYYLATSVSLCPICGVRRYHEPSASGTGSGTRVGLRWKSSYPVCLDNYLNIINIYN